jgi:phage repressor protein C with HTH and peptisase S24 domain
VHESKRQKLSEIVKQLRGERSQRDFANALSVSQATVQSWESGRGGNPTLENIQKLAAIAKLSPEEFMRQLSPESNVVIYDSGEYVKIPIVAVVGAGGGANPHLEATGRAINFPVELFRKLFNANPDHVDALEVMGDSMAPTLNHGDLVLIDTQSLEVSSGIYMFIYEGNIFVKRLSWVGKKIRIISDNSAYPPEDLGSADIDFKLLGKVFYICQKV